MSTNATEQPGQEPGAAGATGTEGQEPQSQNGDQGQEPGAEGTQGFDPSTIQDPALRAYLEKLDKDTKEARQEAARYRTERNALQEAETQRQRQNETAEQAAQREADEQRERLEKLERENRDLRVGSVLREKATAAKAHDPALVASLLDAKVQVDDKGGVTNADDLLAELRQTSPYLFKRTRSDGGDGNGADNDGAPAGGSMNDIIRGQMAARRGRPGS